MPTLTCLLPFVHPQQPIQRQLDCIAGQNIPGVETLVLNVCGGQAPPAAPRTATLQLKPTNWAALLNQASAETRGDLCLIGPHALLEPGALEFLALALERHPRAAMAYAPYWLNGMFRPLLEDIGDLTESRDSGWVRLYRGDALRALGGWDAALDHAADYDLQLRMMDSWETVLVPRPLYRCEVDETTPAETAIGRSPFRLPSSRAYSVFSYLQYGPEREREIEQVFERWLRTRGAWLDAPTPGSYDPACEDDHPLVTVVIPCRNRARFVAAAVQSALAQTYDNFEVLVVDNGSTDGSPEAVEALGDARARVIRNNGATIASALNRGVREARGVYIAQLDSDDLYEPHTLAEAVRHLREHPEAGLAVSYYDCIDDAGHPIADLGVVKHLEYSRNNILRVNGAGAVRVWRRGVILELGGFDEGPLASYGEDYDLLLKLGERYEVVRIHDVLYHYRRHDDNTDAVRDPLDNIRLKTLARWRALARRAPAGIKRS